MAELDENKNGVFGGIEFGNGEENQSISNPYFEGTIEEPVIEEASNIENGGVFGSFSTGVTHDTHGTHDKHGTHGNTEGFTPIGLDKSNNTFKPFKGNFDGNIQKNSSHLTK